jgi:hypothetical protein
MPHRGVIEGIAKKGESMAGESSRGSVCSLLIGPWLQSVGMAPMGIMAQLLKPLEKRIRADCPLRRYASPNQLCYE